jgi:indolepyruvate ferredoxin oxidoreductase
MLPALRFLARLKRLRGTAFDPFGRTAERRTERALIVEYEALLDELLAGLDASNHAQAVALARIPEQIRGYGHVKERHLEKARAEWAERLAAFRGQGGPGTRAPIPIRAV